MKKIPMRGRPLSIAAALFSTAALAQTTEAPQTIGLGAWNEQPILTIGETVNGYTAPGIPDGMGAFDRGDSVEIVSNHELVANGGYTYTLGNGTQLAGARITSLIISKETRQLTDIGLAFDTIYNRAGEIVDAPGDLEFSGLNRLCAAGYVAAGQAGFVDDALLTGEETNGGSGFVLDVASDTLYAVPWLGRAAWESAAALDIPGIKDTHIALLIGDDRGDAPMLLYVGKKQQGGNFLERNGLTGGRLYMWVASNGDISPADWNGTGSVRRGRFVEVENYNAAKAGSANSQGELGFDALGFATQAELDAQKAAIGAFNFSRPEDLHTNPAPGKGGQVIFASTGRNTPLNQGADLWGTTYVIDVKINKGRISNNNITANFRIVYDGDDAGLQFAHPDLGIRSPDNLVWADDGYAYLQEDRSVTGFGEVSGEEASIWQLDPVSGKALRVAQVNRTAVPAGQTDTAPTDIGNWETSGIIDVTELFGATNERLLFLNTQAHSVNGGDIAAKNLVEGGQYLFLSKAE